MRQPTEEQFLKDVSTHQMTVAKEDGIYRHLRFKAAQNGWNQWFDLVTWPGFLTICGDMGTWTFARVEDMFTFFRSEGDGLRINASYWSEKLQHGTHGGRDGAKVFDFEVFAERLLDRLKSYDLEGDDLARVRAAVKEEVLDREEGNGQYALMNAAAEFEFTLREAVHGKSKREVFRFDPCELPDGKDYAYHFIWCLYAIVWGIRQYDARKS